MSQQEILTGSELEDCTILAEITGQRGEVRRNVHFIRKWPVNSWMYARYAPGYDLLGRKVGRLTVGNVNTVDVTIFSPQYSTKRHYVYQGAEKDKDVAERCKNLKLKGWYRPFGSGLVWDTERGAFFTLQGVAIIPRCRVAVTFKRNTV